MQPDELTACDCSRVCLDVRALQSDHARRGIGVYIGQLLQTMAQALPSENRPILLLQAGLEIRRWTGLVSEFTNVRMRHPSRPSSGMDQLILPFFLKAHGVEVFHSMAPLTTVRWITLPYLQLVPTVATVQDLNLIHFAPRWGLAREIVTSRSYRLQLETLGRMCRILVPSQFVCRDLQATLNLDPQLIQVAPYGCPYPFASPRSTDMKPSSGVLALPENYVLFIGEGQAKNLLTCLRAIRHLDPALGLVAVGRREACKPPVTDLLEETAFYDRVRFTGWVSDHVLSELYKKALCLVFPSYSEGFGFPVLEAMNSGCPVICSNTTALPEVAGNAAIQTAPDDYESIARAMDALYRDATYRSRLAEVGRAQAAKFSWGTCLDLHLQAYRESRSSRRRGPRT